MKVMLRTSTQSLANLDLHCHSGGKKKTIANTGNEVDNRALIALDAPKAEPKRPKCRTADTLAQPALHVLPKQIASNS